ncbi:hypothetical protein ATE92_1561 [Ulvibacter sp. MAR_2010_11]|uniref:hypothetical protein n=1 Tax=Ulvibacter sp. MAR_2010_11 TaxID=1250229 RepID=UPI000C2BC8D6|nr:hypothetical protein [Ulvibacter sp. MAR_2010_11]PKA83409.1 hypothetical protein ATE92_1561 [Ulvibacter sp. MAR_2010_11]
MELHLNIVGWLLIVLALIHVIFPGYFNWKENLSGLTLINRQMMVTHTFFIALTVFLMGVLCVTSAKELVETELGRKIVLGLGLFWSVRFVFQQFVYSSKLWKGKKFETTMHVVFTALWVYFSIVFLKVFFEG